MTLKRFAALLTVSLLGLTACSQGGTNSSSEAPTSGDTPASAAEAQSSGPLEITDAHGTVQIPAHPQSVIATDNRIFETLEAWNIKLSAAPVTLMASTNSYKQDTSIVDLGNHREPNLEAIVAVKPDLILNGQRFAQYYEDIKKLAPEAALLDTDLAEDKPFGDELKKQTTMLGEIFGKQAEAAKLVKDFDASIERVKAAYDPSKKVMAVITSGGEINYSAPGAGRTLGPVFELLGLTPSLETEGSSDHQGDDISVEAIAQSNPDWILVMDRDAAVSGNSGKPYTPANELIANSAALQNVNAVLENHIVYMPEDTYINESIQTYTEFFNQLADALEQR